MPHSFLQTTQMRKYVFHAARVRVERASFSSPSIVAVVAAAAGVIVVDDSLLYVVVVQVCPCYLLLVSALFLVSLCIHLNSE